MTNYRFALLLIVCASTKALAQQTPVESVGVVETIEGLVTVSQGNSVGNLKKDSIIVDGAFVANTSTGSASIRLANGCGIGLGPNQAVLIDASLECKAQSSKIQSNGNVPMTTGNGKPLPLGEGLAIGLTRRQNSSGS
jgi:hypothetical protein